MHSETVRMLIELVFILPFGLSVAAYLVLRTSAADRLAPTIRRPFEILQDRFFPRSDSGQMAEVIPIRKKAA